MTEYRHDFGWSYARKKSNVTLYAARELPGTLLFRRKRTTAADIRRSVRPHVLRRGELEDLADFEFSEYGRDSRFPAGWWLLPAFLLAVLFSVWIVNLLV